MERELRICPRCNKSSPANAAFCNVCGAKMPRPQTESFYTPEPQEQFFPSAAEPPAGRKRFRPLTYALLAFLILFTGFILFELAHPFVRIADYYSEKADRKSDAKQYETALRYYEKAMRLYKDHDYKGMVLVRRGRVYISLKDYDRALKACREAQDKFELGQQMDFESAAICQAQALYETEQYGEAAAKFDEIEKRRASSRATIRTVDPESRMEASLPSSDFVRELRNNIFLKTDKWALGVEDIRSTYSEKSFLRIHKPTEKFERHLLHQIAEAYIDHGYFKIGAKHLAELAKISGPDDGAVEFLQAKMQHLQGADADALKHLERIISSKPDHRDALYLKGTIEAMAGRCDSARAAADALWKKEENRDLAAPLYARALLCSGSGDTAVSYLKKVLENDPRNIEARLCLADTVFYSGSIHNSLRFYEKAAKAAPGDIRTVLGAMHAYARTGEKDASFKYFKKAKHLWNPMSLADYSNRKYIRDNGLFDSISLKLPDAYFLTVNSDPLEPTLTGYTGFSDSQTSKSTGLYESFAKTAPSEANTPGIITETFLFHKAAGMSVEAGQDFQALKNAATPGSPGEFLLLIKAYVVFYGDPIAGLAPCELGLKLFPDDPDLIFIRGKISAGRVRYDETVDDMDKALASDPQNEEAYFIRGKAVAAKYACSKNLTRYANHCYKAVADIEKAIVFNPEYAEAYSLLADINRKDALKYYAMAISIDPSKSDFHAGACGARLEKGQLRAAFPLCNRAITLDPAAEWAYYRRAEIYAAWKDFDNAMQDYSKAIELAPKTPEFHTGKGRLLAAMEKYDEAISEFRTAIYYDHTNKEAAEGLLSALKAAGRTEEAERIGKRFEKLGVQYEKTSSSR